jgi:glycosyltransferase involved in cell wall biosynthesis
MLDFLHRHPEIARDVIPMIDVAADDLRALYSGAEVLLFPSLAEGFGWPIIEAQACGCRVAVSNRSPLTEIGGEAALYLDPDDPAAAALAIESLFAENRADRRERIRRGLENAPRFSTVRMIRGYLAAYRSLTS